MSKRHHEEDEKESSPAKHKREHRAPVADESDDSDSDSGSSDESSSSKRSSKKDKKRSKKEDKKRSKKEDKKKDKKKDRKKHGDKHKADRHDIEQINAEDHYFVKNAEFRVWLAEEKHEFFDDMTTEQQRTRFARFVEKWNGNDLPSKYYKGLDPHVTKDPSTRTQYKWGFAAKLDAVEMGSVRDSVDSATSGGKKTASTAPTSAQEPRRVLGPTLPSSSDLARAAVIARGGVDPVDAREAEIKAANAAKRAALERAETMLDEVAPKETGREAMLLKKREKGANARAGSQRDDFVEMNDSDLMGGNDFQARLRAQKMAEQRRAEGKIGRQMEKEAGRADRMKELQSKEDQTMAMFREMAKHHKLGGQPPTL